MDKQIITFSANEQHLHKTGGLDIFATKTVSYIEAHFDLGQNWSGYDSVEAVWWNDRTRPIRTVLDTEGICIVPPEVLTKKGEVYVNLVGVIASGNTLTDRLTSVPITALTVKFNAHTDGTETTPLTPSQFEQFVAIVRDEVEEVTGMTAQAETLPAGSQATARYENGILYLGIPQGIQGERGETGADGNGIASVVYNADYSLTLAFDNGERFTTPPIRGERGPAGADGRDGTDGRDGADGVTPNLSIGTVETLEPTQDAYVTRRGTDDNPIIDFGIPKGDTGEVTMSQLSSLLPTDTASGDIASFSDGTDLFPALSVKAQIEPIQDLHGYDKPWSGGAGRNLLNVGGRVNQTSAEVRYTSDDNYIILNGTKYGAGYATMGNLTLTLPAGTYYAKAIVISGTATNEISLYVNNGTSDISIMNAEKSFTLESETTLRFRFAVWNDGTVLTNYTVGIVISKTSGIDKFYPYSNICPISGRTSVDTIVSPTTSAEDGNTYTTPLGRTVYGGTLDVVTGELVVDRAMVTYDGSSDEAWSRRATGSASAFAMQIPQSNLKESNSYVSTVMSNYLEALGASATWGNYDGLVTTTVNATDRIIAGIKTITEIADWRAHLTSNPLQVVYELATPQTYQLDPTEVDLLLGQNNLWTDCGSVEVTYKADVGLYIDKKLSSNGTRSLSMGLTKSATAEAETETEPSKTEADTKTEEAETEETKTETEETKTETETEQR